MEFEAHLQNVKSELAAAERAQAVREAPLRVMVEAKEREIGRLRADDTYMSARIAAYEAEVAELGRPKSSLATQAARLGRIVLALGGLFAAEKSFGDGEPKIVAFGIAVALVGFAWGARRE